MKLASFTARGRARFGIVTGNGIVDLSERTQYADAAAALAAGPSALEAHAGRPADWALADIEWLPPIVRPIHLIGIGLNTRSHFQETAEVLKRTPGDYPKLPRLFMRSPHSHVAHQQALRIPKVSRQLDYEGEIAVVIGKACRYVERTRALEYIGGYACYNDGSVRDFQKHSNQVTAGKNFARSGAFGPWLTTADEIADPNGLTLRTKVNGEVRQHLVMDDLIFGFAELIAYISQIFPLQPGDTILTGSPAGIGALEANWLVAGDQVEIEVPGVGTLRNPVKVEADE